MLSVAILSINSKDAQGKSSSVQLMRIVGQVVKFRLLNVHVPVHHLEGSFSGSLKMEIYR